MSPFTVDGQRQGAKPAVEIRLLHLPATPLPEVIESSDTGWAAWDEAVLRQDMRSGATE